MMNLIKTEESWKFNDQGQYPFDGGHHTIISYYDEGYRVCKKYIQNPRTEMREKLYHESWHFNKNWNTDLPAEEISLTLSYSTFFLHIPPGQKHILNLPDGEEYTYLSMAGWCLNGDLHRKQGHAFTKYDMLLNIDARSVPSTDIQVVCEAIYLSKQVWYRNGITFRRQRLPVTIGYGRTGKVDHAIWIVRDQSGNTSHLYEVYYYKDGTIQYIDNHHIALWQPQGPTRIGVYKNGSIEHKEWANVTSQGGREILHRENGPAYIEYREA